MPIMTKHSLRHGLNMLLMAGLLTVLCGCWDIKDINHRALPIAMGLENNDGGYKIYLLIPQKTQGREETKVVTGTGPTINDIIDQIGKNMEMQVDLLHLKVVVFERGIAERGLGDSVSSFMRSRFIPPKTIVAVTDENLEHLFDHLKSTSTTSGLEIYNYFGKNAGWSPQVAQTRVWQIFRSLGSYTHDVVIPIIKTGRTTTLDSTGSAVIKNGKMVGRINSDETLLYNAFNGISTQGKIEVMNHASVMIVSESLRHHTSFEGKQAVLNSRLTLKVTILETKGAPDAVVINRELNELLTARFNRMFRKIQSEKADILGLGQFFRTRIPRDRLKDWRTDYYPGMQLNLKVNTIIQDDGLLKLKA
ncbi:Ger(x)C family spore germination protein [Paenibacillus humicola]|uniref:Ger(x)C family spore germination protein n=1 Tax=Paenibacillus humicola TaxID=3110540 RepID=UPI00237A5C40|nr:Ger(x)C family spore germination protein [Paenibacillus humicola]